MKKITCLLLAVLLIFAMVAPVSADHVLISDAVVLMDADTGEVLWQKNSNKKKYPASITKVMTALLTLENAGQNEIAYVTSSGSTVPKGYAHIALQTGDTITVEDALYAMMLPSANDAANVLAEHVAGSQNRFAALMNSRAREIGATNTNFTNAGGVQDENHYTTAYDMALITRQAISHPQFFKYFGETSYTLPQFNDVTVEKEVEGQQFMLFDDKDEYYAAVTGGKIGYTQAAGHTMTTVATYNGRTLICVVMGSTKTGKYEDTRALLNYGFRQ